MGIPLSCRTMKYLCLLLVASPLLGMPLFVDKGMPVPLEYKQGEFGHCCGSMLPYVRGGESYFYEPYIPGKTTLRKGDWLVLYRQSDGKLVGHELTAMNERAVYTSGVNNRFSDGWSPKSSIVGIVRVIVRQPVSPSSQVR